VLCICVGFIVIIVIFICGTKRRGYKSSVAFILIGRRTSSRTFESIHVCRSLVFCALQLKAHCHRCQVCARSKIIRSQQRWAPQSLLFLFKRSLANRVQAYFRLHTIYCHSLMQPSGRFHIRSVLTALRRWCLGEKKCTSLGLDELKTIRYAPMTCAHCLLMQMPFFRCCEHDSSRVVANCALPVNLARN